MRLLMRAVSPPAEKARLSILIFHRVLPAPDPLLPDEMHAGRFDSLCGWVRQWFNVLPLAEACARLRDRSLPARAMAITFDDGYADNHDVALPILKSHGLHATFFVATGFLDGGRMWNDTLIESVRRARHDTLELAGAGLQGIDRLPVGTLAEKRAAVDRLIRACRYLEAGAREAATVAVATAAGSALPDDLMMSSLQVQRMHQQGMALGGHTVNHPILTRLPLAQARDEIEGGKRDLESLIQVPVRLFAYPNGRPRDDFAAEHAMLAREAGFEAAVSTAWGVSDASTDPYELRRFTPWDQSKWTFGLRLAQNARSGGSRQRLV